MATTNYIAKINTGCEVVYDTVTVVANSLPVVNIEDDTLFCSIESSIKIVRYLLELYMNILLKNIAKVVRENIQPAQNEGVLKKL